MLGIVEGVRQQLCERHLQHAASCKAQSQGRKLEDAIHEQV